MDAAEGIESSPTAANGGSGLVGADSLSGIQANAGSPPSQYEVWDDYQRDGYLKPDTYRCEGEVEIWEATDPRSRGTDSPKTMFTWGFSLAVENKD